MVLFQSLHLLFILMLISLGYVATDLYLPSLPAVAKFFATSNAKVQATIFTYLVSFSIAPLLFGPLSDSIGRKKVISMGLIITICSTISCFLATSIYWLLWSRLLQGIGLGAVFIASRAILPDLYSGQTLAKQISWVTMLRPFLIALAPVLGGWLQEAFNWQAVFLCLLLYLIAISTCMFFFKETLTKSQPILLKQHFASYQQLLTNSRFILHGMGTIIPSIGVFAYFTSSPFLYQNVIGLSASSYGVLAIYISLAIVASSFINIKLVSILPLPVISKIGSSLMLAAGLLMLSLFYINKTSLWSLLLPSLLYFACIPLVMSNAVALALDHVQHNYGAASALLAALQFLAGALGSFIFAYIEDSTNLPLSICFIICGGFCLLGSIGLKITRRVVCT